MCGIAYVAGFKGKPVNNLVKQVFYNQKHRGSEGFGLYDYDYKNLVKEPKERKIMRWLDRYPSTNILFHHRLPTSTENVKNACHPFSTKEFFKTQYILVHNGMITNAYQLKAEHEKLGIVYSSIQPDKRFNDSEALAWDVALYLEGKQDELKARGSIAFICMALGKGNKHDRLHFARNDNPINMKLNRKHLILSSEGAGEPIDMDMLYSYDLANGKITTKPLEIHRWLPLRNTYKGSYWDNKDTTQRWDDKRWQEVLGGDIDYEEAEDYVNGADLADMDEVEIDEIVISTILKTAKGSNFQADVYNLYKEYMWLGNGVFSQALSEVDKDYVLLLDFRRKYPNDKDVLYTVKCYTELKDSIELNPLFKTIDSIDGSFVSDDELQDVVEHGLNKPAKSQQVIVREK